MRGYGCLQTDWTEHTEAYASRISSEVVSLNGRLWLMPSIRQCRNSRSRDFQYAHAPQIGLSRLMVRIRSRVCLETRGRPDRQAVTNLPSPVPLKSLTMPTDSFRFDDDQGRAPTRPQA